MNKEKGFIKYVVIIIVILVVVFFSQQAYFRSASKSFFSPGVASATGFLAKGASWVNDSLLSKISGEVQQRGDMAKQGLTEQKAKISENVGENIKNYFSGIVDSVFHPGDNKTETQTETQTQTQACPPCPSPFQPNQP